MGAWLRAYRTPLWLLVLFLALLAVLAGSPREHARTQIATTTAEPTPGPHECVVCQVDRECDAASGRCVFVDHTPLPCVRSAAFDDAAGFCLPSGAPEQSPQTAEATTASPGSSGRSGAPRQPRSPGLSRDIGR